MLGENSKIVSGFAFKSSLFNSQNKGLPIVRIRDVGQDKSKTFYDGEYSEDYVLENGDYLVGMDGEFRLAQWQGGKALLNQRVCKIIPDENTMHGQYMYYMLPKELKRIEDTTPFATVKHLSVKKIKEIKLPLPPLAQQKKIAAILDAADAYRQKTKALVAKYDELSQSLFLDMFGDPVGNNKQLPEKKLGDIVLKITTGSTPKGGKKNYTDSGVPFLRCQNVWRGFFRLEEVAHIPEDLHKSLKKSRLKHGDILMTKTGRLSTLNSSLGRAAIYKGLDDKANISTDVFLIRLKEGISKDYIAYILASDLYNDYLRGESVGGTDKRHLYKEHLEGLKIIWPPHDKQNQFAERLEAIEAQKAQAQASLAKAEDLFNSLLQKAFKGELTDD